MRIYARGSDNSLGGCENSSALAVTTSTVVRNSRCGSENRHAVVTKGLGSENSLIW